MPKMPSGVRPVIAALIALAAAGASHALAADPVIKIGGLLPISGPGSYFGAQDKQGIELALEAINKSGVNGFKFEIQYEDSSCSPLPATQAAKRLLDQYKPDVVIGEECSDATLAVMPVLAQAKVPLLNAGSSSIKVTEPGNPWTFRIMPNEVMQGVDIATNAYKRLNARTAVLLYENTNAGIGNAKVFGDTFTSLGGKILADIGFGRDVNDFTPIATRVAGVGKVDVIPTYTLEGQGLKITQAPPPPPLVTPAARSSSAPSGCRSASSKRPAKPRSATSASSSSTRPTSATRCAVSSRPSRRNTIRTRPTSTRMPTTRSC